jgi:hypothetical protein
MIHVFAACLSTVDPEINATEPLRVVDTRPWELYGRQAYSVNDRCLAEVISSVGL